MAITIEVKAPTQGARDELALTKKALEDVTTSTKKQGDAAEKAGRQGSSSAQQQKRDTDALGASLRGAGSAFSGLIGQLQREKDMMEAIRGPMQSHQRDIEAVTALYRRGAIDASEFTAKSKALQSQLDSATRSRYGLSGAGGGDGAIGDAVKDAAGQAGPAGEILGSITTGAAVQAGAVIGLVGAVITLRDAYIDLHNQALRIAGVNGDVNGTIQRQLTLAGDLHGSLATTMSLTAKVREGTEDLGFTQQQVAAITKTVGQAVELSGHPLEDATGLMDRLSYAFESGTITGRELKSMMREFPTLGDLMSKSFQKSRKDLVEMANDGKLNTQLFINTLLKGGPEIDAKFGARIETVREKVKHLGDEITVFVGQGGNLDGSSVTGAVSDMSASQAVSNAGTSAAKLFGFGSLVGGGGQTPAKDVDDYQEKIARASGAETQFYDQLAKVSKELRDQSGFFKGVSDAIDAHNSAIQGAFYKENTAIAMVVSNLVAMNTVLAKAAPGQIAAITKSFGGDITKDVRGLQDSVIGVTKETRVYGDIVAEAKTKTNAHTRGIQDLNSAYKDGAITAKEYSDKLKELSEDYAFQFNLIKGIIQPAKEWNLSIGALNSAFTGGTISISQYNDQLAKLNAQPVDKDKLNSLREAFGLPGQRTPSFVGPKTFGGIDFAVGVDTSQAAAHEEAKGFGDDFGMLQQQGSSLAPFLAKVYEQTAKLAQVMGDARTPAEKYAEELNTIADAPASAITDDDRAKAIANLRDKYTTIKTPAEQFASAVSKIREEQQLGLGSAEAYDDALRDLRVQFGQGTMADGLVKGLQQVRKEVTDVAGQISTTLVDAFHSVNDALVDLITTGTTDWRKMVESMERELAGNLLKSIEGGIANAIGGNVAQQAGAAATGVTTGTSAAATMLAAAPGIGLAIGAAAASTMSIGGGIGDGTSALTDALKNGGLPGFATGGSFTVGGDGGRDTTPIAFMATRGERVTVDSSGSSGKREQAATPSVRIVNVSNQREATLASMNTRDGEKLIMNGVLKNRSTLRGHILK